MEGEKLYAKGTIILDKGILPDLARSRFLFVIARPKGRGFPVAVRKYEFPSFPLTFSLSDQHGMGGAQFFQGDLDVIARLDQDGNAGPKQPDDWEGSAVATSDARLVEIVIRKNEP